uniref:Uncharacterized protein n=1 Tax=Musca domestica TaxID=7370 RepID=A0A1I8NI63_MUSDO
MNYTQCEVSFNKKYIANSSAWVEAGLLNMDINVEQVLTYGIRGIMSIQIKIGNSKNFQRLFTYEYDMCKLLNEVSKVGIINLWYRNFLKKGNFMENCPIAKGHYYARNISLDPSTIPVFLRAGEYQINSLNYYGKKKTKSFESIIRFVIGIKIY